MARKMEGKPRLKTIEDVLKMEPSPPLRGLMKGIYLGARGNFMYHFGKDLIFCTEAMLDLPHSGSISKNYQAESLEKMEDTFSCNTGYVLGNLAAYPAIIAMDAGKYAFEAGVFLSRIIHF